MQPKGLAILKEIVERRQAPHHSTMILILKLTLAAAVAYGIAILAL
jgi:hypothetical protein